MKQITKHSVIKHLNRVLLSLMISVLGFISIALANTSVETDFSNFKPVKPYFNPNNQINTNLLLLIDQQNAPQWFGTNELELTDLMQSSVSQNESVELNKDSEKKDTNQQSKGNNSPEKTLSTENKKPDLFPKGLPAKDFFLTQGYLDKQEKERNKIQSELKQFGVLETPKSLLALSNLKKFNQTVVQDTLIDNFQKQLLIGLRGSLFSYHFRSQEEESQTLTTDEIITKRIRELPDTDRAGEYKRYLLALDAFKNENFEEAKALYASLTNAKHNWIAQSANYMLIEIEILDYEQTHQSAAKATQSQEVKTDKKSPAVTETAAEIDTLAKLHHIETLVDNYQNLYPLGDYLNQAKLDLFELYQQETDSKIKTKLYPLQASYFDALLQKRVEYELALSIQERIVSDVINHIPFNTENSKGQLNLSQAYELQPNFPMLDFIDTLDLLSNIKKSGLTKKALSARAQNVSKNLAEIGQNSLGHYLMVEANWRVFQDSGKTLAEISELNLDMQQASQYDIFALYMIQSEAYLMAKRQDEAVSLWLELLKSPITAAQKVYLELRIEEIATLTLDKKE